MSTTTNRQQYSFQAEIKQLLHLLSHSLYQSREIAIRELVSNASDALDKMRFLAMTDESQRDTSPLEIVVEGRPDARELVIRDNGIGMTHDELVSNLGTIAHSGSLEFLKNASASGKADVSLIGQFGVGFYAAFMLADRVRVRSRSYREESGHEWESDGSGSFSMIEAEGLERGTEVVLHLKDDAKDFAEEYRIKSVLKTYSGFVPHPIKVGDQVVNDQKPIWVEPKNQVTEEQHAKFFQYLTHRTGRGAALAPPHVGRLSDPVSGRSSTLPEDEHREARLRSDWSMGSASAPGCILVQWATIATSCPNISGSSTGSWSTPKTCR